ncbi:hypothetical protein JW796_04070 [Candidatus Dojkabacteria bacterium]|nr:hypothetical protein [Candidatus Dojkabacteria bacterium]
MNKFEKRTIIIDSRGNKANLYASAYSEQEANRAMGMLVDEMFIDMSIENGNKR